MITKIAAARRAERSGTTTVILSGQDRHALIKVADDNYIGTTIHPTIEPLTARKQWIANQLQVVGSVELDEGASRVLNSGGASLLAVGVSNVRGDFQRGDLVACCDSQGKEIARGLINYSAQEVDLIKGRASGEIEKILGYVDEAELIHRDNLALV
jgi:glutamate 5-kinase